MQLYPYQEEAIQFHIRKKYSLNAFTMGLGKTFTSLEMARRLGLATLIVCPAFLKQNWKDEIEKVGLSKSQFTITSYASFSKVKPADYQFIIMDEAHYIKNPNTKRTHNIFTYISNFKPEYVLMMTGTPMKNNVGEFFMYLKICDLKWNNPLFEKEISSYERFQDNFMHHRMIKFSKYMNPQKKYYGSKNMVFFKEMIKPMHIRKKLSEVKLPPVVKKVITGTSRKFDKEIQKAFEENDKPAFMSVKAKSALITAKATIDLVKSFNDEQIIIFSDHVASTEAIATALKAPYIHGAVSEKERNQIIDSFRSGKCQYICATYKTLGVGVTLTNCSNIIYNDLPLIVADVQQASKRIHRIGATKTCFYYYMFTSKVHEDIYKKLILKHRHIGDM